MSTTISLSLLTIIISVITFWFIYKTLKEGNNALNEIKIFRVRTIPTLSSNLKRLEKKKQRGELKKSRRYNDKY